MVRLACSPVGAAFSKFPTCRYNANDMAKLAKAAASVLKEGTARSWRIVIPTARRESRSGAQSLEPRIFGGQAVRSRNQIVRLAAILGL